LLEFQVVGNNPWLTSWAKDLVGDALYDQGDLVGALESYRDSLGIREKLASQDPENAGRQHDLSVSYDNIGNILKDQGDLVRALESYRDSLAIRGEAGQPRPRKSHLAKRSVGQLR